MFISDYKAVLFVYLTRVHIFSWCGCVFLIRAKDLFRADQWFSLLHEIPLPVLALLVIFPWFSRVCNLRELMDYAVILTPNDVLMGDVNGVGSTSPSFAVLVVVGCEYFAELYHLGGIQLWFTPNLLSVMIIYQHIRGKLRG